MHTEENGTTSSGLDGRLREHPVERFAGDHHAFDLSRELEKLRGEGEASSRGHRQVTLFHHGPVAQVLFAFEANGSMPNHTAHGWVTIHVLEGNIQVTVGDHSHHLGSGQLLSLDPMVPHSLRATAPSAMLLTVHIQVEGKPTPLTLGVNE